MEAALSQAREKLLCLSTLLWTGLEHKPSRRGSRTVATSALLRYEQQLEQAGSASSASNSCMCRQGESVY